MAVIAIVILLNACASNGDVERLETLYYQQSLESSYDYAQKYADDDFLWAFQSGILGFQSADFEASWEYFNGAEVFFEENAGEGVLSSGFKGLVSILLSNAMFEYSPNLYEAVLVNYYKAINAIMRGDYEASRVEFNRANDRQRRSKEFFAKRISEVKESLKDGEEFYKSNMPNADSRRSANSLDSIYASKYQNLAQFRAFEGYVNPMVSYVSGVFFLAQNDFSKARDLLKESYAISQKREILSDIAILEARESGKARESYTWIFIEDGAVPKRYEMRLDAPLFLINSKVLSLNVALPNLDNGRGFSNTYKITQNSAKYDSFEVANLQALVANEFDIELPYIIITSLISSSYKAYLQYVLNENFGIFGSIGGAIFSAVSTRADIRNPRILPLRFFAMRVKNATGTFHLRDNRKEIYKFSLNSECAPLCVNRDNIIYLRMLQNGIISGLTHSLGEK